MVYAPAAATAKLLGRAGPITRRTAAYTGSAISALTSTVMKICCSSSR